MTTRRTNLPGVESSREVATRSNSCPCITAAGACGHLLWVDMAFHDQFNDNPTEYDDVILLQFATFMHDMWANKRDGQRVTLGGRTWSLEDIVNYYVLILNELDRRNMKPPKKSELDKEAKKLRSP